MKRLSGELVRFGRNTLTVQDRVCICLGSNESNNEGRDCEHSHRRCSIREKRERVDWADEGVIRVISSYIEINLARARIRTQAFNKPPKLKMFPSLFPVMAVATSESRHEDPQVVGSTKQACVIFFSIHV